LSIIILMNKFFQY